jgi:hypothetical protein
VAVGVILGGQCLKNEPITQKSFRQWCLARDTMAESLSHAFLLNPTEPVIRFFCGALCPWRAILPFKGALGHPAGHRALEREGQSWILAPAPHAPDGHPVFTMFFFTFTPLWTPLPSSLCPKHHGVQFPPYGSWRRTASVESCWVYLLLKQSSFKR